MYKKIIFALITIFIFAYPVCAENRGILLDDCADFSFLSDYSDGIYTSVIDEESRNAYDDDYTMFMRNELTEEWVEYEINKDVYPVFNTYFRQNEEISHFVFEESADRIVWSQVDPQIKIAYVENYKWIPVTYSVKGLNDESRYIRIKFSNQNAVEWSPMIASVYLNYETTSADGFSDCINTPYEEATSILKNLGFANGYNEYEFKPYNNVSRAEFAKMNADILNIGNESKERVFSDVESEYWASGYIASLYRQGIINGDENGCFNPDANVTYAEAAKMIISSLGYTASAEDAGGYPTGYLMLADRYGIFEGITSTDKNMLLSRGDMAIMISNALETDVLVQTEFGCNASYKKYGNVLEVYHDILIAHGIVEGVGGCSIIADMSVDSDAVIINGETYTTQHFDMSNYLGMAVSVYYKTDNNVILYAMDETKKVVNIDAPNLLRVDDNKLYYDVKGEKEAYIPVDNNTRIVYNGRYKSRIGVMENLSVSCGDIKVICNEKNLADVIIIKEYKKYIPLTDGNLDNVINDRLSGAINLDFTGYDKFFIEAYGEKVDLDNANYAKGDVICIAESEDKKVIYINILSENVCGIIEYSNSTTGVMRINNTEYEYTDDVIKFGGNISVGSNVVAYRDINGRIFALDNSDGDEYAYIIECGETDVFSNSVNLKMITQNGEIKSFNATEQTKINGERNSVKSISSINPQLVKIKIKSNGSLAEIISADGNGVKLDFSSENSKYFGGALCVFSSKYQIGINTPIFFIPEDNEDSRFKVITRNGLYSDFNYNVRMYNVSNEYVADAVVIYENGSKRREVDSFDEVAVIKGVEQITNAQGEMCLNLSVYIKGQERNIYFDNEGGNDNTWNWIPNYQERKTDDGNNPFKVGEVIQFYSDSESHCRSFRMLMTADILANGTYYEKNIGDYGVLNQENYYSELYTSYGKVEKRFSDKVLISVNSVLRTIPINSCSVYVYNKDRNSLKIGNSNDIYQGADVFVRMTYGETTDIIVFE